MSKNKNKKTSTANKGRRALNAATTDVTKKGLTKKGLAILITAIALLVAIITTSVVFIVLAINEEKNFDYLTSDLSKYISISADDYKNYSFELDIAKPHTKKPDGTGVSDVEVAILNMIAADVDSDVFYYDAAIKNNVPVTPGDAVYVWYRGYLLSEDGEEIEVSGMSNFAKSSLSKDPEEDDDLVIGSGKFLPGFELGLVGKVPSDYAKFVKITEGTVTANQVVYINYSMIPEGADTSKKQTATNVRLDLSDPDVAAKWADKLVGKTIGQKLDSFTVTEGAKTYIYSDLIVKFATECENSTEKPPILVECYFPYDYSVATLRNETAYFEVYIEGIHAHNPWHADEGAEEYNISYDWNDEYLLEKLNKPSSAITYDELMEQYVGESLTDRYEKYAADYLEEGYQQQLRSYIESKMWSHYLSVVKVKKYPKTKVDEIYQEYYNDVYSRYEYSGGSIYDSTQLKNVTCDNIDDFATIYLKLQLKENPDWRATLRQMAEELVSERLILYYIMNKENLTPDAQTLSEMVAKLKEEYSEEYIAQYLAQYGKSRDDYDDDEWAAFVEARNGEVFNYYKDEYFTETAYYEIVLDTLITYPEYTTYDDGRRAWPSAK